MKTKFQSKSPFIQTGVLAGVGSLSPKTTNNGGTHTCNTFVHTSKRASERASKVHTLLVGYVQLLNVFFFQKIWSCPDKKRAQRLNYKKKKNLWSGPSKSGVFFGWTPPGYRGRRATWNWILARGNYGRLSGPVRCLHFLPRSPNPDVAYLRERHVSKAVKCTRQH